MKLIYPILTFLISFSLFSQAQTEKSYQIRTIAFYNLENLFDTINNPDTFDDDRTPTGKDHYTSQIYGDKIEKLSKVIAEIGTEQAKIPPVILGVVEVENHNVLKDIAANKSLEKYRYEIIHYNSPDRRGVDVAFMYQPKYFKPSSHEAFELRLWGSDGKRIYTRDQLLVSGYLDGELIHIIVNHWPSRRGGEKRSSPLREKAAQLTQKIITNLRAQDTEAKIIVMGDFNDDPINRSIKKGLDSQSDEEKTTATQLFNPFENMYKKGMSTLGYRDNVNLFDQILISKTLLKNNKQHLYKNYTFYKAHIYNPPYLTNQKGRYKGYPFRSYAGGNYTGGYSDHYPVNIFLIREMPNQ